MGIAMLGFALAAYIPSKSGFLAIAFISRFIQGFASSSIQTTCFAISGIIYAEHQAAILGYLEMSAGLGLTIAPVIGSFLYDLGGFNLPFIFFGAVFITFGLFLKCIIPYQVDIASK